MCTGEYVGTKAGTVNATRANFAIAFARQFNFLETKEKEISSKSKAIVRISC